MFPLNMPVQFLYWFSTIEYWQYQQQYRRYRIGVDLEVFCQYRNGAVLPVQFLFWFFTEIFISIVDI